LGLYDLYRAFGRVEGSSNEFTQWASEIAARPWEQEGAPKQFQTYKPLSHGLMGRFNLGDLLPGALENFQSRYRQIYSLCQFVEQAMGDPARHYHDLRHIEEALELGRFSYYNQVPTSRSHDNPGYRALLWAILFHDVVYVPGRKDNEVLSAEEALQRLKETNLKSELVQIKELIEWTRTHDRKTAKTPLLRAMFDADMGIFGVGPTRYDEYARSVRVEWVGSGAVTEEQYRVGRRQFLEKVLKEAEGGSFFFALDPFFSKMAFLNIRREIESL
jgi:predicted metal-dependent HD superfamily phosphohydrolase